MAYPIKEKLLEIPIMKKESDNVIEWLLEKCEYKIVKPGDYFFKKGDKVEEMTIILEGEINFMVETGGNFLRIGSAGSGDITGVLPFSRMTEAGGASEVGKETHCLNINKKFFPEMEKISPTLVQNLVGLMSDRVRNFTMRQQQREKMEALGKMSAGIAHELNNPASAIRSTSRDLDKKWLSMQELTLALMGSGIDVDSITKTSKILQSINNSSKVKLSMLEKGNMEDELIDFFDDLGFENGMELAEDLVEAGLCLEDIEEAQNLIDSDLLEKFLKWYINSMTIRDMIHDINDASERISNLVGSIKSHSHMDRAPEETDVDLRKGLESTLVIFQHKIKEKNIGLQLNFNDETPIIQGMEGELNQVWTNIIDNALDALEESGNLKVSITTSGDFANVLIKDDGPGIPENIKSQIFEPFFTTKALGKGTGLGLDISSRIIKEHNGNIEVDSKPGETIFNISLPLKK